MTPARVVCIAALACAAATAGSVIVPLPGPLHAGIVLIFCCWAPGVALFAILEAWKLVLSPAATIIASLSLIVLISQAMLALHIWAPLPGTGTLAVVCAVLLVPGVFTPRLVGQPT